MCGHFSKNLQQFLTFAFQKQTNMLQVHFIRENKEEVITRLAKKNFEATAIVELIVELTHNSRLELAIPYSTLICIPLTPEF